MRIVVADQDSSFLEPFRSFLHARGHEASTACDGVTCLNVLREFEPDVLAISSNLLWGGSEGVLSLMREDGKLRDMPVLLLQEECGDLALRRHPMVTSTTRRPFRFDELIQQLKFLAILGEDESCEGEREIPSVANRILDVEQAIWNA